MNPTDDIQTELLRNIWNEMKALGRNLGGRIDATNARIDGTNERLDQTNERLGQTNERLDLHIDETGKAFFQLQTRLTTELVAVRTGIDQMVSAFREYRDEDRVLLQAHDVAIGDLRTRVDRLERRAREPERG